MLDRIREWPEWLEGREGSADPSGQAPNPAGQAPEGDEGTDDDESDGKKASPEVRALRREAANLRQAKKAAEEAKKAAEAERDSLKQAQLSDIEKERLARQRAETERDDLRKAQRAERIAYAVRAKASDLGFHDPEDAVSLLALDAIEISDDGRPDGRSVKAAVEKLAKERPHLVKQPAPGGGDGGAKTPTNPKTFEDAVKAREEILLRQGLGLVRIEQ